MDLEQKIAFMEQALSSLQVEYAKAQSSDNEQSKRQIQYNTQFFDKYAEEYIDFTYKNPTIYHVVDTVSSELSAAGFKYVSERDSWEDLTPGKYYTKRNGSALIAFVVGKDWTPEKGVGIIGAHIDALTVVLKPNSSKATVEGYELLGVAAYSGALTDLWWDRDLGIGGRLLVKDSKTSKIEQKLVDSTPHPIAHIPTLAPHFGAPAKGPFNPETQAVPVIGFSGEDDEEEAPATDAEKASPLYGKHSLKLLRYIAKLAKVNVEDILQWDLQLYDIQKGTRGGLKKEFIFAPRIDDRICSFAAYKSLIEADANSLLPSDGFSIVGLFDNEEIGSATRQGIKGQLIESVIGRVISSKSFNGKADSQEQIRLTYGNTIILSADVNHLYNPNFDSVYLEHFKPVPNKGLSIALDPNGHMATDSIGLSLVEQLAKKNGDKVQYFHIRNDSRSGGTIGPSISLQTGARTIDLGIPQLSMHSIRATAGAKDVGNGVKFFTGFFSNWRETYDNFDDL
ncbi:vacuolar aminopeptidase 1 [[Candida] anglica]|uniref:Vacuolar aminopeptidase 1 n=1 Tax=[Candida] anglica TaxID=148631 RepID=A0ABP0EJE6_9ASCO